MVGRLFALTFTLVTSPVLGDPDPNHPGPLASGSYTIDPYHTFTTFAWRHFGLSTQSGRFDKTAGSLVLDVEHKTGQIDVTIDVESMSTGTARLNKQLKSDNFFDAAKFPVIAFKSTSLVFNGARLSIVNGLLTIHGMTKTVALTIDTAACTAHRNPRMMLPACGADASVRIKRSDFGLDSFLGYVSDEILIHITIEAIKGSEGIEGQFAKPAEATGN